MANNQGPEAIQSALTRAYEVLKFTPKEIRSALNDLAAIQQLAVFTELIKSLTEAEVANLNKEFETKTEEEQKMMIEQITKTHSADSNFIASAQAAAKTALDKHIANLKTWGNDSQKEEIAKIIEVIA